MALVDQVKAAIEKYCNIKLSSTAIVKKFDGGFEDLIVRTAPIISITSIVDNYTSTTLASSTYDFDSEEGFIFRTDGACWDSNKRNHWTVTYQAGYTTIPDDLQLAIDTWEAYLTVNPTGALSSYKTGDDSETYAGVGTHNMPLTVKMLLAKYKRIIF